MSSAWRERIRKGYHALYSLDLADQIAAVTGIPIPPCDYGRLISRLQETGRRLLPGQPRLARLLQVVVFETLITAVLNEVPGESSVVGTVRAVMRDHARDEGRHHRFFAAFLHELWAQLDPSLRAPAALAMPELWFKLLLFELTNARDLMIDGNVLGSRDRLRRCGVIDRMLPGHFNVLDTMVASDFRAFREALGTASGAQSAQFAEIECLSGLRDTSRFERRGPYTPAEFGRLRRRLAEPTVWDGFLTVLGKSGFEVSSHELRSAAYREIAENREQYALLWDVVEALLDHGQAWSMWRARHVLTVERQIGAGQGTGGTLLS